MTHTFASQSTAVTVEWGWMEPVAGNWARALLIDGSTAVVDIATQVSGGVKQLAYRGTDGSWNAIQTIADDTWYTVKVIADPAPPQETAWVDIFVDGVRQVSHAAPLVSSASFTSVTLRTNETLTSDLYIDNASVAVTESVNSNADSQSIMDQEIQYAAAAGIDYWAFVYYPSEPLAQGRELYLSSAYKDDVNWCAILDGNFLASYDANLAVLASHFGDTNYQKVLGDRPLVFFLTAPTAAQVTSMRTAATSAGASDPYIVVMAWTAADAASLMTTVDADAVSRYATGAGNGAAYSALASSEVALWSSYASAAGEVIPTVTTGWDERPRYDYPVSWEPDYTSFATSWAQQATPSEIATHLSAAISWSNANPTNSPANAVLIYAWNEFDEGGWICPTLYEIQNSGAPLRLNAIAAVSRT
jgi:hypothetical protein